MMDAIDDTPVSDAFIRDIQGIANDIHNHNEKNKHQIREHLKNISSNPEHTYTAREQIAVLMEIMKCYNDNMIEYQKNLRDLSKITKNLIKAHRSLSEESHSSDETIKTGSSISLYEYFIQLLWGKPSIPKTPELIAVSPGNEPSVNFYDIFGEKQTDIQQNPGQIINEFITPTPATNKNPVKKTKRRNTVQPIIKHFTCM